MSQQDVFEVVDATPLQNGTWRVRGRAYEDISVGDCITPRVTQARGTIEPVMLQISAISSYGGQLDTLNRMMTGELIVRGPRGTNLAEARMLVRQVEPSRQPAAVTHQEHA